MLTHLTNALILALGLTAATSAFADPPPANHNHWINTNYPGHYFLYDNSSRQWIETINCRVSYRFNLVSNQLNVLTLHDPTRNMTVRLEYGAMYLKANGAANFSFYQNGTFDTRQQFSHSDFAGNYSGAITKQHACQFVEYLAGSSTVNYRFTLSNNNNGAVEMYDGSRNVWVKLDNNRMYLKQGSNPYQHFRNGHW